MSSTATTSLKILKQCFPCLVVFFIGAFVTLTVFYSNLPWLPLRILAALLIAAVIVRLALVRPIWKSAVMILALLVLSMVWRVSIPASNDRTWRSQNAVLTTMEKKGDHVIEVQNVRNFTYNSRDDFEVRYEDRTYDLRKIQSVDFVISYWGNDGGDEEIAHTFLSFGFEGDEWVSISIEIRAEEGESFHPLPGSFRQYEMIYVVGDEKDVIGLRTEHRGEKVFLYPSSATPEQARELFFDMLTRANELAEKPEFYGSLGANCTTSLVDHLNSVLDTSVPFSRTLILNGLSDRFAYKQGYLVKDLPFDVLKNACLITTTEIGDDEDFSNIIRKSRDTALDEARKAKTLSSE